MEHGVHCPFCHIMEQHLLKDQPEVVEVQGSVFVIKARTPVVEGHVLVMPRRHVRDVVEDLDCTVMVMRHASDFANRYTYRQRGGDAYGSWYGANILTSIGESAGQTVPHLHLHIIPRRQGDGLRLPWSTPASDLKRQLDSNKA